MNKKGFTLIEILAIVVLIGVVAVIAIPNVTKQADDHSAKQTKLVKEQIINASKMYFSSERISYLIDGNQCVCEMNAKNRCKKVTDLDNKCKVRISKLIEFELLSISEDSTTYTRVYIARPSKNGKIYYNLY